MPRELMNFLREHKDRKEMAKMEFFSVMNSSCYEPKGKRKNVWSLKKEGSEWRSAFQGEAGSCGYMKIIKSFHICILFLFFPTVSLSASHPHLLLGSRQYSFNPPPHLLFILSICVASLISPLVKNLPTMQETPVWFLGQEDSLEKG